VDAGIAISWNEVGADWRIAAAAPINLNKSQWNAEELAAYNTASNTIEANLNGGVEWAFKAHSGLSAIVGAWIHVESLLRIQIGTGGMKYCAFETVHGTVESRRGSTLRCAANPAVDWRRGMKISARNVFEGKVQTVIKGAVNSEVALVLAGGECIVSVITNPSVDSLGLVEGKTAYAIIKANEVIVGKGVDGAKLSARNVLAGEVISSHDGAVNSEVAIQLAGGVTVIASITKESVHALGLQRGDKVSAIVKASNVLIGV